MVLRNIKIDPESISVRVDDLSQNDREQVHATADCIEEIVGREYNVSFASVGVGFLAFLLMMFGVTAFPQHFSVTNFILMVPLFIGMMFLVGMCVSRSDRIKNETDANEIMGLVAQSARSRELLEVFLRSAPRFQTIFDSVPSSANAIGA